MPISADELDRCGLQVRNYSKVANPKEHRFLSTRLLQDSKSPELSVNTDQDVFTCCWVSGLQIKVKLRNKE